MPALMHLLRAVEVAQEGVERRDALLQPALEERPFGLGQHPRDDVERDQPLGRLVVAVDREGDADAAEEQLGLAAAGVEELRRRGIEPFLQGRVGRADSLGRMPVRHARHLVERPPAHRASRFVVLAEA